MQKERVWIFRTQGVITWIAPGGGELRMAVYWAAQPLCAQSPRPSYCANVNASLTTRKYTSQNLKFKYARDMSAKCLWRITRLVSKHAACAL